MPEHFQHLIFLFNDFSFEPRNPLGMDSGVFSPARVSGTI